MIQVIGIGGLPATGKTTLMRSILKELVPGMPIKFRLIRATLHSHEIVLGIYDNRTFGGTDRLSMAAMPDAMRYLELLNTDPDRNGYTVLFEGDRLFSAKFIIFCQQLTASKFVYLEARNLASRHQDRNDTQSDSWLKGRQTKYSNLTTAHKFEVYQHNTPQDTEQIKGLLLSYMSEFYKIRRA